MNSPLFWENVKKAGLVQVEKVSDYVDMETEAAKVQYIERLTDAYIIQALQKLGVYTSNQERHSVTELVARLNISPIYGHLISSWLTGLTKAGFLRQEGDFFVREAAISIQSPDQVIAEIRSRKYDSIYYLLDYMQACGDNLIEVLYGKANPLNFLFPNGSFETAESIYQNNTRATYLNSILQAVMAAIVQNWPSEREIRVLEVGAGTGGSTSSLLEVLPVKKTVYYFTDLSNLFLARARHKFKSYRFMRYGLVNVEEGLAEQGVADNSIDIVVASNVLHATTDLEQALRNIRVATKLDGLLLLYETTTYLNWFDISLALFESWQKSYDNSFRVNSPMLSVKQWQTILSQNGYNKFLTFPESGGRYEILYQNVILAGIDPNTVMENS